MDHDPRKLVKDLTVKKKKVFRKIKKAKVDLAGMRKEKVTLEKKIKKLKGEINLKEMPKDEATKVMEGKLESLEPEDMYPKDLEKEFAAVEDINPADDEDVIDLTGNDIPDLDEVMDFSGEE